MGVFGPRRAGNAKNMGVTRLLGFFLVGGGVSMACDRSLVENKWEPKVAAYFFCNLLSIGEAPSVAELKSTEVHLLKSYRH